jgi:hypothetical protein
MNGQPNRSLIVCRKGDPMPASGRQPVMVSFLQSHPLLFSFYLQHGPALQNHHPLIPVLLIPNPRRAGLPMRNNPFNTQSGHAQQVFKTFMLCGKRQIFKQVFYWRTASYTVLRRKVTAGRL